MIPHEKTYYKCLTKYRTGGHTDFTYPAEGESLPLIKGDLELCETGYHFCEIKDLLQWDKGGDVHEFLPEGEILIGEDKLCSQGGKLGRKLTWTDRERRLFACDCAERTLPIFEAVYPDDKRPREAIAVSRRYAQGKATGKQLTAARVAAGAATQAAAEYAAQAASGYAEWAAAGPARFAARAAEKAWQEKRLYQYLYGEV